MQLHRSAISPAAWAIILSCVVAQTQRDVPGTYPTIQSAIQASTSGDTVLVAPGTYFENIDFLGKNIIVRSRDGANVTTIDGGQLASVVRFRSGESSNTALIGFTIRNGRGAAAAAATTNTAVSDAGGIDIRNGAAPRILRCRIVANFGGAGVAGTAPAIPNAGLSASRGGSGGIYAAGPALITDCEVSGNVGGDGALNFNFTGSAPAEPGAGGLDISAVVGVHRCRIEGNIGGTGAAAPLQNQIFPFIDRCGGTGGIDVRGTFQNGFSPEIDRCRIVGNVGGGIGGVGAVRIRGIVRLGASLIADNQSGPANPAAPNWPTNTGGIAASVSPTIEDCTIAGNRMAVAYSPAPGESPNGAGVQSTTTSIPTRIRRSIIVGNTSIIGPSVDVADVPTLGSVGVDMSRSCSGTIFSLSTSLASNISANPMFVDAATGNYRLAAGSPCINLAPPETLAFDVAPKDLEGNPRWLGASPDAGAFEFGSYDASLLGSDEDAAIASRVLGQGSPYDTVKTIPIGSHFGLTAFSPRGTLGARYPVFVVDIFGSGMPPIQNPFFPDVHWGPNRLVLLDGSITGQNLASLPYFTAFVPPTISGLTVRIQVVAWEPLAKNGFFVATDAHDAVIQ